MKRLCSTRACLSEFINVLILYLLHFCKSYGCSKVFFFSYNPLLKIEILFLRILWQEVYIKQELIPMTSEPFSLVYFNRFYRSYGCSKFVFPHTNLYYKVRLVMGFCMFCHPSLKSENGLGTIPN